MGHLQVAHAQRQQLQRHARLRRAPDLRLGRGRQRAEGGLSEQAERLAGRLAACGPLPVSTPAKSRPHSLHGAPAVKSIKEHYPV